MRRWYQSRTISRAIIVALVFAAPIRTSSAQNNWGRYKPGTLAAATSAADSMIRQARIEVKDTGPSQHFLGDREAILATVIYKGASRPIDPIRHRLIAAWSMSLMRDSSIAADFDREYLFQEGDKLLWLPVQDTVASFFPKELRPGQRVSLYVLLIAADYADGVITWAPIVNEFEAIPVESAAAGTVSPLSMSDREQSMTVKVTSPAFQPNGLIPPQYTCDGNDVSPPLSWSGAPSNTKSFAMIVDDPDAPDPAKPQRVYVHWVVYNLPPGTIALPENASKEGMPKGAVQGKNDSGKAVYRGPCPPIGRHRYFFKLYALDTELTGLSGATKADLEKAMKGHVIDSGELIGTYQKSSKK